MNVAFVITSSRIFLLIPIWFFIAIREDFLLAAFFFSVAAATDFLDGWFARKFNCVSNWGIFYDPFADKVLVLGTFFLLFLFDHIHISWGFFLLLVSRDIIITFLRLYGFVEDGKKIKTSYLAKFKTAIQFISLILLLGILWLQKDFEVFYLYWICPLLVYSCIFFSYISFVGYIKNFIQKKV